jgi:subtilisin-like proprotein convertase family protein
VVGLIVGLNISGGYNGDLYAHLAAPNGTLVTLLNQPGVSANGFGAGGAGMTITLQDGTGTQGSIQSVTSSSVLSGTYNAANSLAGINRSVADGNWTLYFADLSSGGGTSTLNSWFLGITAVPEPVNMALAVVGMVLVGGGVVRRCLRKTGSS